MGEPFVILHSRAHIPAGLHTVELLLLRVQRDPQDSKGSGFSVSLEWVTVANTSAAQDQEQRYEVSKRRLLTGKSVPHYAALEPQGKGLMVASEKPFACTHVDGKALEQPAAEPMEVEATDPIYFWQQTEEDVTVSVRMPEGFSKDQVQYSLTGDWISVGVQGFAPILEGTLHAPVDPEASAWIIKDNKSLQVTLQKREEGSTWAELVPGDRRGEYVVSEEQAALIHQRLTHLTVDDLNANGEGDKPPCNSQELEDCDGFPEDSSSLTHFDGETLKPTQVVSKTLSPSMSPRSLCLSLSLSVSVSVSHSLSLSPSFLLSISLSPSMTHSVSLPPSPSLFLFHAYSFLCKSCSTLVIMSHPPPPPHWVNLGPSPPRGSSGGLLEPSGPTKRRKLFSFASVRALPLCPLRRRIRR
ncbi:NudC domain-containing protein 1 [Merluccius polli]|uniref:NudC domain-containing protein 1 n=1 Tax=Merluccius polli TaxID=89951 RepID=A0AA47P7V9_MERPO|nr:NudC domain-containing protein 1 [Merluccius polli]